MVPETWITTTPLSDADLIIPAQSIAYIPATLAAGTALVINVTATDSAGALVPAADGVTFPAGWQATLRGPDGVGRSLVVQAGSGGAHVVTTGANEGTSALTAPGLYVVEISYKGMPVYGSGSTVEVVAGWLCAFVFVRVRGRPLREKG